MAMGSSGIKSINRLKRLNMKKLFIKETDEAVEFGDVVVVDFSKELEDGEVVVTKEIKITPATVAFLLEMDVLEEREVEDELIDFGEADELEDCPFKDVLDGLMESVDMLRKKILKLEEEMATVKELIRLLKPKKEDKTASTKKK